MEIKEYLEIVKDGKTIAKKTCMHQIVHSFTSQMHERGLTTAIYFTDKEKVKEQEKKEESFLNGTTEETEDIYDYPTGLSWSPFFTRQDMLNFIMHYLDATASPKSKLMFVTQLQNMVMNELIEEEEEGGEEFYDEEDD